MSRLIVTIALRVHNAEPLVFLNQRVSIDVLTKLWGKRKKGEGRWLAAACGASVVGHNGMVLGYE